MRNQKYKDDLTYMEAALAVFDMAMQNITEKKLRDTLLDCADELYEQAEKNGEI